MDEPSLQVTQAGLGQSQQENVLTSAGSASATGSHSSWGQPQAQQTAALLQPQGQQHSTSTHTAPFMDLNKALPTLTAQLGQPEKQQRHLSQSLLMERSCICLLSTKC